MINVYLDDFNGTKKEFEKAVKAHKNALKQHKKTVDMPAPIPSHPIIAEILGEKCVFVGKTRKQVQDDKNKSAIAKYESEKKKAQKTPSHRYAQFRSEEYPPITDALDAVVKWMDMRSKLGDSLPDEADKYLKACLAVKEKYPKPDIKNAKKGARNKNTKKGART